MNQTKEWLYIRRYIIIKILITICFITLLSIITHNNTLTSIYNIFTSLATGYILTEYYHSKENRRKYNDNVKILIKQLNAVKSMITVGNEHVILEYFILAPYRDTLAEIYNFCDEYNQRYKEDILTLSKRLKEIENNVKKYSNGDYKLGEPTKLDIQFCINEAGKLFL